MTCDPLSPLVRGLIADAMLEINIEVAHAFGYCSDRIDEHAVPSEADLVRALREPLRLGAVLARLAELLEIEPLPEVVAAGHDCWNIHRSDTPLI